MSSQCPWGPADVDLRQVKLTVEHKRWLALAHLQGHFTVKELHQKYSLSIETLYIYIRRVRGGEPLREKYGSPRKLDGKSLKALKDLVDENPEIDEQPLRAQIIKEYRVSEGMKLSFDVTHRLKPLSLPTDNAVSNVMRLPWINKLLSILNL